MKYLDTNGRLFQPGLLAEVLTGKVLWVDAVHGNDDLAERERMTIPFMTLASARDAAQSGDTIVVLPGTYDENDLAKDGVNWHFLPGAIVDYDGSGDALFDTTGGAMAFKVTGHGVFKTSSGTVRGVYLANSGDDVSIEFDEFETSGSTLVSKGALTAVGHRIRSLVSDALYIEGSSNNNIDVRHVEADTGIGVHINASSTSCVVRIRSFEIVSNGDVALGFTGGTAYIDAYEIKSTTDQAVAYDSYGNHPLHLRVNRIVSTASGGGQPAITIDLGSGSSPGQLRLYDCILISQNSSYSITSVTAGARYVLVMGTCYGNKDKDSYITFKGVAGGNPDFYQSDLS